MKVNHFTHLVNLSNNKQKALESPRLLIATILNLQLREDEYGMPPVLSHPTKVEHKMPNKKANLNFFIRIYHKGKYYL